MVCLSERKKDSLQMLQLHILLSMQSTVTCKTVHYHNNIINATGCFTDKFKDKGEL